MQTYGMLKRQNIAIPTAIINRISLFRSVEIVSDSEVLGNV